MDYIYQVLMIVFYMVLNNIENLGVLYGEFSDSFDKNIYKVSHCINNIKLYDDRIFLDLKILDTKCGKEVKSLLEDNFKLFPVPIITGDVDENGKIYKIKKLTTFNLWHSPSIIFIETEHSKLIRMRKIKLKNINVS
jgi:hypothetical protein